MRTPILPRAWFAVAGLCSVAACDPIDGPEPPPPPPSPFVISNSVALAVAPPTASPVVYVSLPPGTIPTGLAATIHDRQTGATATVMMVGGGFDPVPVEAYAGDTVTVVVQTSGSASPTSYLHTVPVLRRPIVVRTDPPPHKRDVPLNVNLVVVFSEPISPGSLTTAAVQLRRGDVVVSGQLSFADETHLKVVFAPSGTLLPGTDYELVVTGEVRGVSGAPLEAPVAVPFTTASSNVSVSFSTCPAVWVAYQDGDGAWVPVTAVDNLYRFSITQSKGGVAYVQAATGQSYITLLYYSQAELTAATLYPCGAASPAAGKTVTAMVVNLPIGTQAWVSFGSYWESSGFASTSANGPVQLNDVLDGPQDLVASAVPLAGPTGSNRMFLARGLNPASGGSLGTIDFAGAGSFTPTAALITLVGGAAGETYSQSMLYVTGPAGVVSQLYDGAFGGSSFTAFGVGAAYQVSTDLHNLGVTASMGSTATRYVGESFHTMAPRTMTLPSALGTVTVLDAGGPYLRPMLVTTLPADLNSASAWYCDQTVKGKCVFVKATAAWLGGRDVSLTLPDFSGLAGWSNAWAPPTGDNLNWYLYANGNSPISGDGLRVAYSSRNGSF